MRSCRFEWAPYGPLGRSALAEVDADFHRDFLQELRGRLRKPARRCMWRPVKGDRKRFRQLSIAIDAGQGRFRRPRNLIERGMRDLC